MMASHLCPWTMLQSFCGRCHPWAEKAQCVIEWVPAFMGSAAFHVMRGEGSRGHWGRCITENKKKICRQCHILTNSSNIHVLRWSLSWMHNLV